MSILRRFRTVYSGLHRFFYLPKNNEKDFYLPRFCCNFVANDKRMKKDTAKSPVRLRWRELPSGRKTLYLDIYVGGRRSYEYLSLYLEKGSSREVREANRETLKLAEAVCAKRTVEVREGRFGFSAGKGADIPFMEWFAAFARTKKNASTRRIYDTCALAIADACPASLRLRDLSPAWGEKVKASLSSARLSPNSRWLYFSKVRAAVNGALAKGLLRDDPLRGVANFKWSQPEKVFLTFEEVRAMARTPCADGLLKRAFLFSCLTGLRFGDVQALTWEEVRQQGDFTRITFRQHKTGGQEYLDISPQAAAYMGERGTGKVFAGFKYSSEMTKRLRAWARDAGVRKPLTFHSGRHTFAVMMLDLGTDIYTTSKLLGHSNLSTTQVYAKVLDKNKQAAVMRIPDLGGD